MPLQTNVQALILGKPGSGKSLLARTMLAEYVLAEARSYYIAISTKLDHADPPSWEWEIDLQRLGFQHLMVDQEAIASEIDVGLVLDENPRLLLTLKGPSPDELEWFMHRMGGAILERGNTVLLVDEADRLVPRRRPAEHMLDLVRRGRYEGVDLLMVSHSDSRIHPEVFEDSNMLIAFCTKHPTRIDRLRYFLDDPAVLAELEQYEYLCVDEPTNQTVRANSAVDFARLRERAPYLYGSTISRCIMGRQGKGCRGGEG